MTNTNTTGEQMLRREPSRATTVSDWELGISAVLLLILVVLTTLIVPTFA